MPLNPHQIDDEIVRLGNLLEDRSEDYARAISRAAVADSAHRKMHAVAMLRVIDENAGKRTTVDQREAMVDVETADSYAAKAMTEATAKGVRAAMEAIRVQIDVARTLSANIRQLTGPN